MISFNQISEETILAHYRDCLVDSDASVEKFIKNLETRTNHLGRFLLGTESCIDEIYRILEKIKSKEITLKQQEKLLDYIILISRLTADKLNRS